MNPQPTFDKRDYSAMNNNGNLSYKVTRLLWNVMGGCDQCDIDAYGDLYSLWGLTSMLRCPVTVWDQGSVWWGYVHELVIHFMDQDISFSLEPMLNSVAVGYTDISAGTDAGGERKTTAFATNATSIAAYGTKQGITMAASSLSDTAAEALRDTILAAFAKPKACPEPAQNEKVYATLFCRGWWGTLGWKLANTPPVTNLSSTTYNTVQAVGSAGSNEKVMQQITVGGADIHVMRVQIYGYKVLAPTDEMRVSILPANGHGHPEGDTLWSGTIRTSEVGTSVGWLVFDGEEAVLAASTMYCIVVDRTGEIDGANYFVVGGDTGLGYAGGVLRLFNGTDWVARGTDADLDFKVEVNEQKTVDAQIEALLTSYAQFMSTISVVGSTATQGTYQDGDSTAIDVVEELMEVGGANSRRVVVRVTKNRGIVIAEETAEPDRAYYGYRGGRLTYQGQLLALHQCNQLLGQWVDVGDTPPHGTGYTSLDKQYVESVEWTPDAGIQPRFKGRPTPEELSIT